MNLAIQGHSTLGKEVITLLKMLGGKNPYDCNGLGTLCAYHIIDGNIQVVTIEDLFKSNKYILYSLEGLLAKFPYKVGNSARLSRSNVAVVIKAMKWENDEIVYKLSCDDSGWWSVNNLKPYREKVTENNVNYCQVGKITAVCFQDTNYEDKVELQLGNNYEIKEENGKYYAVKKQPQYPKTYEECCDILQLEHTFELKDLTIDEEKLIDSFICLKRCRDAYWKIAGEQMGLGKHWEPDYNEESYEQGSPKKYVIYYTGTYITKGVKCTPSHILAFPTEEMRDAFFENFKELIELCKELL